ncbi:hypothetical protein OOT46_20120 [Aquabacterium sp. A7-Y]|uniref:hypothetical protein n=1 Tax=Aquabacterium sp. A7-Y TaxID=1349605 RepID=UPI00223E0DBF|nr:hypothetical protein [Aquabacterium sp. A7-Y]MCW7540144.1 hypothetical protein [Aquabacterium sp. A7-Y]
MRDAVGCIAQAMQRFAFRELLDPLGMRSVTREMDRTGTAVGGHYMLASARDWARFGQLFLNDGMVDGRRLLSEGWTRFSTTPTLDTDYGAGWWINRGQSARARGRVALGLPADAYSPSAISASASPCCRRSVWWWFGWAMRMARTSTSKAFGAWSPLRWTS